LHADRATSRAARETPTAIRPFPRRGPTGLHRTRFQKTKRKIRQKGFCFFFLFLDLTHALWVEMWVQRRQALKAQKFQCQTVTTASELARKPARNGINSGQKPMIVLEANARSSIGRKGASDGGERRDKVAAAREGTGRAV
jgi:hypothetical protein